MKSLVKAYIDTEATIKHAYKYNLKKKNNTYGKQGDVEYTQPLKQKVFFIPHLEEPSGVLTEAHVSFKIMASFKLSGNGSPILIRSQSLSVYTVR